MTTASIALVVAAASCAPTAYDPNAYDPNAFVMTLDFEPEYPETGETVTFVLRVQATDHNLVSSGIDFDGDGVWDETRPNDDTTVQEVFTHAYASAAEYKVRARVVNSAGTPIVRTTTVTVNEPVMRSVDAVAQADYWGPYIGGQRAGACLAIGSPFTWPGDTLPIEGAVSIHLGDFPRGATVGVAQLFGQSRWATTPNGDFDYACDFTVTLHARRAGNDVAFAPEECSTTSREPYDPARLQCLVDTKGEVP